MVRTTVTLDPDVEQIIRRRMHERHQTFKEAINDAICAGVAQPAGRRFTTETSAMGESTVNLDRALPLVGDLEDDELVRRQRTGSWSRRSTTPASSGGSSPVPARVATRQRRALGGAGPRAPLRHRLV